MPQATELLATVTPHESIFAVKLSYDGLISLLELPAIGTTAFVSVEDVERLLLRMKPRWIHVWLTHVMSTLRATGTYTSELDEPRKVII